MDLNEEIDMYVANLPKTDYKGDKINPPTKAAIEAFRVLCHRTGLSPITRQIYMVPRWDKNARTTVWSSQTSIDGFRAIADRSPKYQGQAGPFWAMASEEDGGKWSDIPPNDAPYAAKVGVYIEGRAEPTWSVAKFDEYDAGGPMWKKMPGTMIAKCAEALALRKALPAQMAGLYTAEEMAQANKEKPRASKAKESAPPAAPVVSSGKAALEAAQTVDQLNQVMRGLSPDQQVELVELYKTRKADLTPMAIQPEPLDGEE